MKLFKIVDMLGAHTRSALDPSGNRPAPPEMFEMFEAKQIFLILTEQGFAASEQYAWMSAMFHHQWNVMGLKPSQAWKVTLSAVEAMKKPEPFPLLTPPVIYFAVAFAAVVIVMVVFNPTFTDDYKYKAPPTMYLMTYRERVWLAELHGISPEGVGYYQRGIDLGEVLLAHQQNHPFTFGNIDRLFFLGTHTPMARKLLIFHIFQWWWWDCKYIGLMTQSHREVYKLRGGVKDPDLPLGPYQRPGGDIFTPEYEGIYIDYPFLPEMHEVAL